MWTATTCPTTSQLAESCPSMSVRRISWVSLHSKFTGLSPTRGDPISRLGSGVKPLQANSSSAAGSEADVRFTASASGRVARFQTNSPVAAMLATVSFHPIDENPTRGGCS